MFHFLGAIAFLVVGYFLYGSLVERFFSPDDRKTPCMTNPDGVDMVPLPRWKNLLIQLLNIAGIGPVVGVILGIKFGKLALLIIPVGCIFMGAVHDFAAGMMSLRNNGANLPLLVRRYLGRTYSTVFSWIMVLLLLLVVAVFIKTPADLIDKSFFPSVDVFWMAVSLIFIYYVTATLFPVDKIIGRIYPFFGALLIIGSILVFAAVLIAAFSSPSILDECPAFAEFKNANPVFPCLFVTIACGIISGFHATQSPIVARTMVSEREAKMTFFGMMVAEGVIAVIWASAALAIYNLNPELVARSGTDVLGRITAHFLGPYVGGITIIAVIVLAVTSGDTALRSARLNLAEMFSVDQISLFKRVLTSLPLIGAVCILLFWSNGDASSFGKLWNYFAWGNQILSATALMCAFSWCVREGKKCAAVATLLPGMFMTSVVVSFILWTSGSNGQPKGLVSGGLELGISSLIGIAASAVCAAVVYGFAKKASRD